MTFDDWLYQVCLYYSKKLNKDVHEIYQYIDLQSAKLQYIDNVSPEDFNFEN